MDHEAPTITAGEAPGKKATACAGPPSGPVGVHELTPARQLSANARDKRKATRFIIWSILRANAAQFRAPDRQREQRQELELAERTAASAAARRRRVHRRRLRRRVVGRRLVG